MPGVRPEVYPPAAARDWDALRNFRHFNRYGYSSDLDPDQLRTNAARLERAVAATRPYVEALLSALQGPG